jgi:protein-S-isoprenylcysteine O-methyltransferase Ste14
MPSLWPFFSVGYLVVALACLIQWKKGSLWSRIDIFSGGYLLMRVLPFLLRMLRRTKMLLSGRSKKSIPPASRAERWGSTAAPSWEYWALALTVADLAVYLDYGHWHLMPSLQPPDLQAAGLVLHLAVALWGMWTARYLAVAFSGANLTPALVRSGPFQYIRHPTYAAAMVEKIAVALVFASPVGWLLLIPWCVLLLRQVRLEELHLQRLFGSEYVSYSRQTARLVPGIY